MAYSELIKNFARIRDYMRDFYVYGFKSREQYDAKSARSYDNERRRIESWLGDYMSFRMEEDGKRVFMSLDSREIQNDPLYKAFKAKSFTDNDITLHFYLMDILADGDKLSLSEIIDRITGEYLSEFSAAKLLDESTIRKKLKEYESLGIIKSEKCGRLLLYSRTDTDTDLTSWKDAAAFFSETDPIGVIGSYVLDKYESAPDYFSYKHRYILHALESEILCELFYAISEKRTVTIDIYPSRAKRQMCHSVVPLKIYISVQSGRRYLLAYNKVAKKMIFYRLDSIKRVSRGDVIEDYLGYAALSENFEAHLWGVSAGEGGKPDRLEMNLYIGEGEEYILSRLEREKRCGTVERISPHNYRFSADVYDAAELLPWIRTFICRITSLTSSNEYMVKTFYDDLEAMNEMYGGQKDAVQ